ncbi:hypothetical protein WJX73_000554 [Symbiochloris irregularis]|uniref:D-isomer specific 2-hydroxyacid dehydrogenase catalytic domain-containing protein n=1 Tax=Symbiochloris irregularis TaxID=706552 RepID=A0AAW1NEY2_9CHLO
MSCLQHSNCASGSGHRSRHTQEPKRKARKPQGLQASGDPRVATWEPPPSPFGLVEEVLFHDPWKLLVACMLLNKTTGRAVRKVLWDLFRLVPSAGAAADADVAQIRDIIYPLGLATKRAPMLKRFSADYLQKRWTSPLELHGIGQPKLTAPALRAVQAMHAPRRVLDQPRPSLVPAVSGGPTAANPSKRNCPTPQTARCPPSISSQSFTSTGSRRGQVVRAAPEAQTESPTILVSEKLSSAGLDILRQFGTVDTSYGLSPEQLLQKITEADALIIRSETQVTREVF